MMSTKKKILIVVLGIEAIVIAAVIAFLFYLNSDTVKVNRQLELAQRYLLEEDYEQAIAAFEVVIEIDPKNAEAYLGLAEAYEATDDIENMVKILERGSKRTDSDEISELLKEHKEEIEKKELAAQKAAEAAQAAADASQTNSASTEIVKEVPSMQPNESVAVKTGFVTQGGEIYYYDAQGKLVIGWFEESSNRYCARNDGRLYKDGEYEVDSTKYQFAPSGICLGEVKDEAWKQAYIDYIQQHSNTNIYTLFYMDGDNIPELLVWDGESSGSIVIADNKTGKYYGLENFSLFEAEYESWACVLYMEYRNFVDIQSGTACAGGLTEDNIYSIVEGKIKLIDSVSYNGVLDENGWMIGDDYWCEGQAISEEDYNNKIHANEVEYLEFANGYTANQMLNILESY